MKDDAILPDEHAGGMPGEEEEGRGGGRRRGRASDAGAGVWVALEFLGASGPELLPHRP